MRAFLLSLVCSLSSNLIMAQTKATEPVELIFASDTQEPMGAERLWLKAHGNVEATAALFAHMLAHEPADIFLLGDLVNLGHKSTRWSMVDSAVAKAREKGFRVHAVLGNHELMFRAGDGERRFQERFPEHVRTGYTVRRGAVAVVMLNSNFRKLDSAAVEAQQGWYEEELRRMDADTSVRSVIVCCHHSPYSHSRLVGSNSEVQRRFVGPMLKARKAQLFISGHAHVFQHFEKEGKHFLVIGGGGGLHHPIDPDRCQERCIDAGYAPLFHYLVVTVAEEHLRIGSRMLNDARTDFVPGHTFDIDLVRPDPAP